MLKITGVGAVTPYGVGKEALFQGIKSGMPPSSSIPSLFNLPFSDKIKLASFDSATFDRKASSIDGLILKAVEEALHNAGLENDSLDDTALLVGATGYVAAAEAKYLEEIKKGDPRPVPLAIAGPGDTSAVLAEKLALEGPLMTVSTACTSGANALVAAERMIRLGEVRRAIVVGVELLNSLTISGFNSLMLLSPGGCRPFDAERDGIHLGEAIGAVILERAETGKPHTDEGKKGLFLCGLSSICDTHNVISLNPDGSSLLRVMKGALLAAGVSAGEIKGIKAHGIGSKDNDSAEAKAMKMLFKGEAPPFTSLKGYLGHTLAASALVETIAFFQCVEKGFLPAASGFSTEDPEIGRSPIEKQLPSIKGYFLLNYLGFGGSNTSMVLKYV
ncbi:MAG: beta-ketoacyl synthase N-terminal-like domain-containing protein [bacterium]|nr:beta-ketoacyl synthase N-terminal-like domain-containing protein [bacterium]